MGNKESSTKGQILSLLRTCRGECVSGELLASRLGLSRVSIWKAAQALKEAGYPLESSDRGYALSTDENDDFLYPWEFGTAEASIRHYQRTTSTMDAARVLAGKSTGDSLLVVAEEQTEGRGRAGRSWKSDRGGLFCTLLSRGDLSVFEYAREAMGLELAVCRALEPILGKKMELSWPNDITVDGRKIAGVLTELKASGDRIEWVCLGLGINVNNSGPSGGATSCREIVGHDTPRRDVLKAVLAEIGAAGGKNHQKAGDLAAAWNQRARGRGGRASIIPSGHGEKAEAETVAAGSFLGIDAYGRAKMLMEDGECILDPGRASIRFQ